MCRSSFEAIVTPAKSNIECNMKENINTGIIKEIKNIFVP
jgi:hypothetical protein